MAGMRSKLTLVLGLPLALGWSGGLAAQEATGPWYLRFELGTAEIHRPESDGAWVGGRLGRRLGESGALRLDGGITWSEADEGFTALDLGLEWRALPRTRVTPVLGAGVGILGEPEFTGEMFRAFVGLDVRLGPQRALRAAVQRAQHGGEEGPHVLYAALELGLGRSRQAR